MAKSYPFRNTRSHHHAVFTVGGVSSLVKAT